jgi:ribulose-5-phosphate 4-epimerase/fuculose-1-phosphate aldolase
MGIQPASQPTDSPDTVPYADAAAAAGLDTGAPAGTGPSGPAAAPATDQPTETMRRMGIPAPPKFENVEAERQHRKERLAAGFRLFSKFGFEEGVAGHITARDPELTDHFWVNPFGMPFAHIRVSDLVMVDHDGNVVQGDRPVNAAAFAIHSQVHQARPDAAGAAHSHSLYGKALSTLGTTLLPITQDVCAFYDHHSLFDDYTGVVLDVEEGKRIAHALGDNKAVILRNHGLLTVGETVDAAIWWFVTMERSCQAQLLAMAAGTPVLIDPDQAAKTFTQVGSEFAGWFQFQPLYQRIVREQPDLLD